MRGRSGLGSAVLLLVLAGAALLVATAGPWLTGVVPRPAPLPDELLERTADDVAPAVRALGLVVLAAAPALLAVRGRGRPVLGALVVAAGAGALVAALRPLLDPTGVSGTGADLSATARPWLAAAGAALAVLGGLLVVVRGRGWPGLGRRYEAPAARREAPDPAADGAAAWEALDRGEDPTGG